MTIINKTNATIEVESELLKPGHTIRLKNKEGTISVKSLNGMCNIFVTAENKVRLKSEGDIQAKFCINCDRNGRRIIKIVEYRR